MLLFSCLNKVHNYYNKKKKNTNKLSGFENSYKSENVHTHKAAGIECESLNH